MKKWLYYTLIILFAAIFLFSGWNIVSYYLEGQESQGRFDDLAQQMEDAKKDPQPTIYFTQPTEPTPTTEPTETTASTEPIGDVPPPATEPPAPVILPEYARLYLENTDMVGWIRIDGTVINYPVMQTEEDPDFYLDHNFDKKYSKRGCIYVEEECDVFTPSDNVTIYGHHMRDGSMFTILTRYADRDFLNEHPYIIFDTLLEHRTYQIIAVFKTTASAGEGFRYNHFVNAETPEEFRDYVRQCKQLSLYRIDATAEYGDKLITLSTCEYTQTNGRFVVVAKLIESIPQE